MWTWVIILFQVLKGFSLCTWCILQWDQSLLQGLLDRWKIACLGQKCFQTVTTNFLHLCSTLHLIGVPQTPNKPKICKLYNTMYILTLHRVIILQWLLTVLVWFIFLFYLVTVIQQPVIWFVSCVMCQRNSTSKADLLEKAHKFCSDLSNNSDCMSLAHMYHTQSLSLLKMFSLSMSLVSSRENISLIYDNF